MVKFMTQKVQNFDKVFNFASLSSTTNLLHCKLTESWAHELQKSIQCCKYSAIFIQLHNFFGITHWINIEAIQSEFWDWNSWRVKSRPNLHFCNFVAYFLKGQKKVDKFDFKKQCIDVLRCFYRKYFKFLMLKLWNFRSKYISSN